MAAFNAWMVVLGAIVLAMTNKVFDFFWERHFKKTLEKIEAALFQQMQEEHKKEVEKEERMLHEFDARLKKIEEKLGVDNIEEKQQEDKLQSNDGQS